MLALQGLLELVWVADQGRGWVEAGEDKGRKEVIVGKLGLGVAGESGSENGRGRSKREVAM